MTGRLVLLICCVAAIVVPLDAQPTARRARLTETLRLDASREDFSTVSRVSVGPNKQIVVSLPQDRQLKWYDSLGKRIGAVGRRGDGPGEFNHLGLTGWVGDTMWVHDGQLRRTTFVGPDARVLRTVTPPPMTLAVSGNAPAQFIGASPMAVHADGSWTGSGFTMITRPSGRQGASDVMIARVISTGDARLVHVPPSYNDPRWTIDVAGFQNRIPFKLMPDIVASADGSRIATLIADVTGNAGTFTLTLLRSNGDTVFQRSYPFTGVPIPRRAVDSALAAFLPKPGQPSEGPSDLGQRFQAAARPKIPAVYTPVTGVVLGLDNTVWISMRENTEGREVLVLNGRGDPIATVMMPERSVLRQASLSTIWTTQTDDDGLASVIRYHLTGIACPPPQCR